MSPTADPRRPVPDAAAQAPGAGRDTDLMDLPSTGPEPERFRQVLGHFATGVTVITGTHEGEPVGFACQAFAALSLEPPLVLFCPAKLSGTWPRIARTGELGVNVLASGQRELARRFGVTSPDKFEGVAWSAAANGATILHGVLAWASCSVETVHEAGDHFIVVGRVTELGECVSGEPVLFYRGRFTLSAATDGDAPPEVVDTLLAWPRYADWM